MVTSIISSQILIQCCKGTTFFWNEQIKMNKSYIKTLASAHILPDKSYLNHGFWRNFGMRDFRLPLHYHSDVYGWRFVKSHFSVFCFSLGSYSNFVQGKCQLSEYNGMEGVIIYSPQSIEYQSFF